MKLYNKVLKKKKRKIKFDQNINLMLDIIRSDQIQIIEFIRF